MPVPQDGSFEPMTRSADGADRGPVAIGAIGGSGTRVVARVVAAGGLFLGSDLNDAFDNLWFTLLFKRRDVLLADAGLFGQLVDVFAARMSGAAPPALAAGLLRRLAHDPARSRDREWLLARVESFLAGPHPAVGRWGWKEPNTHVVVDRLLSTIPGLRYVHVTRHGLDMAHSDNQQQLRLWGPIFLGRDVQISPVDSLAYWCAAERRVRELAQTHPGRMYFVDFDALCREPETRIAELDAFLGLQLPSAVGAALAADIRTPASAGRFRRAGRIDAFQSEDLAYLESLGYSC